MTMKKTKRNKRRMKTITDAPLPSQLLISGVRSPRPVSLNSPATSLSMSVSWAMLHSTELLLPPRLLYNNRAQPDNRW